MYISTTYSIYAHVHVYAGTPALAEASGPTQGRSGKCFKPPRLPLCLTGA